MARPVAVVGMGCTPFGEWWDLGPDELVRLAVHDALAGPGLAPSDPDAYFVGTLGSGTGAATVSRPLSVAASVTRVENYCASGSESLRQACYAVAAGEAAVAVAVGVEKLKDSGFSGLVVHEPYGDGTAPTPSAPALFAMMAESYSAKYEVSSDDLRRAMSHVAWSAHRNGARNERAAFRFEASVAAIERSRPVAGAVRLLDCSGVSDGAAAAVVVPAEMAYEFTDRPVFVDGLAVAAGPGDFQSDSYDYTTSRETQQVATEVYRQAGVRSPRDELGMVELHDCFTPNVLVLLEELGLCPSGTAWRDVTDGVFDLDGELPVNPDGGLKSFGHPIGASGLRMLFECWLQLRGDAPPERQVPSIAKGLRHRALCQNAGGGPGQSVAFACVVSRRVA